MGMQVLSLRLVGMGAEVKFSLAIRAWSDNFGGGGGRQASTPPITAKGTRNDLQKA
jgi:hypothetical protein